VSERKGRRSRVWLSGNQRIVERPSGSRETGHHRSDWNVQDVCQFPVRQVLQFAQDEQLANSIGEGAQRPLDHCDVGGANQQRFRVRCQSTAAVVLFIERVGGCLDTTSEPVGTRVANDPEEPRPAISSGEGPKILKRFQRRLLYGILRVVFVAQEPAR